MKLENQICTIEQARKLRELGIIQDSLFYHFPNPNIESIRRKYDIPEYNIVSGSMYPHKQFKNIRTLVIDGLFENTYSAFTVAELSVMLGDFYPSWSFNCGKKWIATKINKDDIKDGLHILTADAFDRFADTQAQALATLLISVIETGFMKVEDINQRLLNS